MKITFVHDDGEKVVETDAVKACCRISKREMWVGNCNNAINAFGNCNPIVVPSLTSLSHILAVSYLPEFH